MSVNPNCAPPQGTLIAEQGEAILNKDPLSPYYGESESDILSYLQPDSEVRMLIDMSGRLLACRAHFGVLMSMLSKLPKDKALPFYQNAAHIFGAFSKDCQNKANGIEQQ